VCDRMSYIDLRPPSTTGRELSSGETAVSSGSAGYCLASEERHEGVDKSRTSDINKRQRNATEREREKERERKREREREREKERGSSPF